MREEPCQFDRFARLELKSNFLSADLNSRVTMSNQKVVLGVGEQGSQTGRSSGKAQTESAPSPPVGEAPALEIDSLLYPSAWTMVTAVGLLFVLIGVLQIVPQWLEISFSSLEGMRGFTQTLTLLPLPAAGGALLAAGLVGDGRRRPARIVGGAAIGGTVVFLILAVITLKLALGEGRSLSSVIPFTAQVLLYFAFIEWVGTVLWKFGGKKRAG